MQGQSQTIMIYQGSGRVSDELVIVYLRVIDTVLNIWVGNKNSKSSLNPAGVG